MSKTKSVELPENVLRHCFDLVNGVQPAANWSPTALRNHADAKEALGKLFAPKKAPAPTKKDIAMQKAAR